MDIEVRRRRFHRTPVWRLLAILQRLARGGERGPARIDLIRATLEVAHGGLAPRLDRILVDAVLVARRRDLRYVVIFALDDLRIAVTTQLASLPIADRADFCGRERG